MTRMPRIRLSQMHGSWLARPNDDAAFEVLGNDVIAVVRDWGDGKFDWSAQTYHEDSGRKREKPDWWNLPKHAVWRKKLVDGSSVWVRQAIDDGSPGGTVGWSKGVWRIGEVEIDESHLSYRLIEQIADTQL